VRDLAASAARKNANSPTNKQLSPNSKGSRKTPDCGDPEKNKGRNSVYQIVYASYDSFLSFPPAMLGNYRR
jgi:hypothetical protein